jgi:hypothetical protein
MERNTALAGDPLSDDEAPDGELVPSFLRQRAARNRLALALIVGPAVGCTLVWTIAMSSDDPTLIGMVVAGALLAPVTLALAANGDLPRGKRLGYALASALLTLLAMALVGAVLVATLGDIGPSNSR